MMVTCRACGYTGEIETFHPTANVYNDIHCPECGSTNNEHNAEYQRRLFSKMRVRCDETTNTPEDVEKNRVRGVIELGG